jgi:hypothetical protein
MLEQNGPAGGNPLYKFISVSEDMIQELADQLTGGETNHSIIEVE